MIGRDVTIGRGTRLIAHVFIDGITTIGEDNTIYPFVSIGGEPQDISSGAAPLGVEIGDETSFAKASPCTAAARRKRESPGSARTTC